MRTYLLLISRLSRRGYPGGGPTLPLDDTTGYDCECLHVHAKTTTVVVFQIYNNNIDNIGLLPAGKQIVIYNFSNISNTQINRSKT